jgi:hypothetical protein
MPPSSRPLARTNEFAAHATTSIGNLPQRTKMTDANTLLLIVACTWVLPMVVAIVRRHHNAMAINVILIVGAIIAAIQVYPGTAGVFFPASVFSWLQVAWVVAMVWSCTTTTQKMEDRDQLIADVAADTKENLHERLWDHK